MLLKPNFSFGGWLIILLVSLLSATCWSSPVYAQVAFTSRYSVNTTGDIQIVGNTLLTCSAAQASPVCSTVQNATATGANLTNNNSSMVNVDVDSDGTTFNSSSANLTLPPSSTVLFAGLYWGGDSSNAARNQVSFATPSTGYTSLTGTVASSGSVNRYQGFRDVTALVQAQAPGTTGTYTVANVRAVLGAGYYAGWSLVVVVRDSAQPARNLVVFDGLEVVSGANVTVPLSGFTTPPAGPVNVRLGTVAYEGDRGNTGDALSMNGVAMFDAINPANDYFNSTISRLGTNVTAKNPNYINQLGFDIDVINVPNTGNLALGNSATSATITLSTGGDVYLPGVVTTAIDIYSPTVGGNILKSVTNLNRSDGTALPGDILEYTISVGNTGQDGAINTVLTDPIPNNVVYVPNSLQVTAGANSGAKTDTAGNDQAEYDLTNNRVVFRLGTGATATTGGALAPAASTTVKFRVAIVASPTSSVIANQATVAFTAQTLGTNSTATSDGNTTTSGVQPTEIAIPANLSITKTDSPDPVTAGNNLTYTITVTNSGPVLALNAVMNDPLPAGTTFQSTTAPSGWTCTTPTVGTTGTVNCTNPAFAVGSAPFTVVVKVDPAQTASLSNTATIASSTLDTDSSNNSATQLTTVGNLPPHVSLVKRITAINRVGVNVLPITHIDVNTGTGSTDDNASGWPNLPAPVTATIDSGPSTNPNFSPFLQGAINRNDARPNDEVEYTIYFLSDGGRDAANFKLCDFIPVNSTYMASTLKLAIGSGAPTSLTDIVDADQGKFMANPGPFDAACTATNNGKGAVVVNVGTVTKSTGPGAPSTSYGFIRFTAKVN
jgi:uncharacterized repeat protein (TIGR01451 family)